MSEIQDSSLASQPGSLANAANLGMPDPMWSQCRNVAIPRLSQAVTMALSYVMGDLTEQAKQARDMNHFRLLEQAKDTLRHGRDGIVTSFQRRFSQFTSAEPPSAAEQASSGKGLSLMSDNEFHDTSSHDVIAQTIRTVCDLELRGIARRFKELAQTAQHGGPVNPLDPDLIGQAVLVALREREVSLTLRRLLAPMLAEHLAVNVRTLYQDILDLFAGKGVFAAAKPIQQPANQDGIGGTGATRSDETIMQHPHEKTSEAAGNMPLPGTPTRGRAISAALVALTRLQQGKIQLAVPTSMETTEILQRLAEARFMADIGNSGRVALDMVTAMFEAILADRRIPLAVRAQLGRLQIPLLKVALLDQRVLKQQDHPARQLLDSLAETARKPALLADMSALVAAFTSLADRISAHFEENLELLSEARKDFQQQLDSHKRPIDQAQTAAAASEQQSAERPDKAGFQHQIRAQVQDTNLPKSVLAFLYDHWESVHRAVYTQPENCDQALAEPSKVLSTLIRTLEPNNWRDSRSVMLPLLPALLKRLKLGMQAGGVSQDDQDKFLAGLAKCHAVVMQAAKELAPSPTNDAATPATVATLETPPQAARPTMAAGQSAMADSAAKTKADKHDALVRSLQRGTLIEFQEQGGSMTWLKLAWISPNGSIFVFTNKQGERALTINAMALAGRFRQEQARVAFDSTVREGSGSHLVGRLQNVA